MDCVEDESGESVSGFETFGLKPFAELANRGDVSLAWEWHC